jgi:hypothetical protein
MGRSRMNFAWIGGQRLSQKNEKKKWIFSIILTDLATESYQRKRTGNVTRERWQVSAFDQYDEIIGSANEDCSTMIKVSLYVCIFEKYLSNCWF